MNAHERAERLFIEAESLGMDRPSEGMVASAINDACADEWNVIMYELIAGHHSSAVKYLERLQKLRELDRER